MSNLRSLKSDIRYVSKENTITHIKLIKHLTQSLIEDFRKSKEPPQKLIAALKKLNKSIMGDENLKIDNISSILDLILYDTIMGAYKSFSNIPMLDNILKGGVKLNKRLYTSSILYALANNIPIPKILKALDIPQNICDASDTVSKAIYKYISDSAARAIIDSKVEGNYILPLALLYYENENTTLISQASENDIFNNFLASSISNGNAARFIINMLKCGVDVSYNDTSTRPISRVVNSPFYQKFSTISASNENSLPMVFAKEACVMSNLEMINTVKNIGKDGRRFLVIGDISQSGNLSTLKMIQNTFTMNQKAFSFIHEYIRYVNRPLGEYASGENIADAGLWRLLYAMFTIGKSNASNFAPTSVMLSDTNVDMNKNFKLIDTLLDKYSFSYRVLGIGHPQKQHLFDDDELALKLWEKKKPYISFGSRTVMKDVFEYYPENNNVVVSMHSQPYMQEAIRAITSKVDAFVRLTVTNGTVYREFGRAGHYIHKQFLLSREFVDMHYTLKGNEVGWVTVGALLSHIAQTLYDTNNPNNPPPAVAHDILSSPVVHSVFSKIDKEALEYLNIQTNPAHYYLATHPYFVMSILAGNTEEVESVADEVYDLMRSRDHRRLTKAAYLMLCSGSSATISNAIEYGIAEVRNYAYQHMWFTKPSQHNIINGIINKPELADKFIETPSIYNTLFSSNSTTLLRTLCRYVNRKNSGGFAKKMANDIPFNTALRSWAERYKSEMFVSRPIYTLKYQGKPGNIPHPYLTYGSPVFIKITNSGCSANAQIHMYTKIGNSGADRVCGPIENLNREIGIMYSGENPMRIVYTKMDNNADVSVKIEVLLVKEDAF